MAVEKFISDNESMKEGIFESYMFISTQNMTIFRILTLSFSMGW